MADAARTPGRPRIIGHRGAAGEAPENTLAGLHAAAREGVRWVEVDVRLTACGGVVLMHDALLDRTTDGSGRVSSASYGAIAPLDAGAWFGETYAGEPVPTLAATLRVRERLGLGINVEAKAENGNGAETAAAMCEVLREGASTNLIVSSGDPTVLAELCFRAPDVSRAIVMDELRDDWRQLLAELGCSAMHCNEEWLTSDVIEMIQREEPDVPLRAFTVNESGRARELFRQGVDAVFTDFPGRLLERFPHDEADPERRRRRRRRPPAA